jgi:hypothetical protein
MSKFNVSDVVVGNSGAKEYNVTIEGWYGIVTEVDAAGACEYITVKPAISIGVNEWIVNPKDQAQYQVAASAFDPVSIVVKRTGSFTEGDVVVGNAGANRYGKTVEGWYGIVTKIGYSSEGREYITVKPAVCNSAGEWILDPTEGVEYPVLSSCFDAVTIAVQQPSPSREAIYDAISQINTFVKIGGVHYSLSSLVGMIKHMESPTNILAGSKILVDESNYDSFLDAVRDRFEANFAGHGGSDRFIDIDSAEFSLNGNRIELDSIDLNSDEVVDTAMECLENVMSLWVVRIENSGKL